MRRSFLIPVVLSVAALLAAGCSSAPASGTETFLGQEHGAAVLAKTTPPVHLHAFGIIADSGTLPLGGNKKTATVTIKLSKGNLTVTHTRTSQSNGPGTGGCGFVHSEHGTYKVDGGTGSYANASGHGTYVLHVGANSKQSASGKCGQQPLVGSALFTIRISGPLTL